MVIFSANIFPVMLKKHQYFHHNSMRFDYFCENKYMRIMFLFTQ